MTLTKRIDKGSPLTWEELDENFTYLDGRIVGDATYSIPTDFADWPALKAYLKATVHTGTVEVLFEPGYTIASPIDLSGIVMPNLNFETGDALQSVNSTGWPASFAGFAALFLFSESVIGKVKGGFTLTAGDSTVGFAGTGEFIVGDKVIGGATTDCALKDFFASVGFVGGQIRGLGTLVASGTSPNVILAGVRLASFSLTTSATSIDIGSLANTYGGRSVSGDFGVLTLTAASYVEITVTNSDLQLRTVDFQCPDAKFEISDSRAIIADLNPAAGFHMTAKGGTDAYARLRAGASFGVSPTSSNNAVFGALDALATLRIFGNNGDNVTFVCTDTSDCLTSNGYGTVEFVMYASTITVDSTLATPDYIFTHDRGRAAATIVGSYGALSSISFNTGGSNLFQS